MQKSPFCYSLHIGDVTSFNGEFHFCLFQAGHQQMTNFHIILLEPPEKRFKRNHFYDQQ
ncbi:uncharacterized protein J3R85_003459 [Psidium guajava]|nr:uncharacterized protein J3R85_003459 [Psidium guajava]